MSGEKEISEEAGTRLLFENERVRVWDLRLEPGQSTGLHRHKEDYLYVVIGDATANWMARTCTRPLMSVTGRGGILSWS